MEVAGKKIFCYVLWILCTPRAAVVVVFDSRLDAFSPADAKNALVVHMDMFVVPQVVIDAALALIRVLHVNLFHLLRNLLVLHSSGTLFAGYPTEVGGSGDVQQLTGCLDRISFLSMTFVNSSVQMRLPYL